MENILLYIAAGIVTIIGLFWLICNLVKIAKMSNDEKRKVLITYLQGAVALAEKKSAPEKATKNLRPLKSISTKRLQCFIRLFFELLAPVTSRASSKRL